MRKTYRVAVIGRTGRGDYGHGIDEVWKHIDGVELVAVADDNKKGLAAAAKKLGLDRAYVNYQQMLDEVKPDIVGIGPRWIDAHCEMVLAAAERGIHFYMEKPFCRTLDEADQMVAACERSHVKGAVALQTRYSPMIPVVQKILADGKLGRLLELRGRGKEDQRGGGEDLWVLGTHIMDLMRLFGGDPAWCAASVSTAGHAITGQDIVKGAEGIGPLAGDSVSAMFGLASGASGYFNSMRRAGGSPSRFGLTIYGTEGALEILTGYLPGVRLLLDPSWSPGRSGASWQDVSSAGIGQEEPLKDGGLHEGNVLAVRDLIQAIETDRQPASSIYGARAATEMIVAVFAAQRAGGRVSLPLKDRGNPLANWSAG